MQVDENIINDFIDESREHLLAIEESLLIIESEKDQADNDLIDRVFRGIHTIKGSAAFLNFNKVTELSHTMESLLDKMRANEIKPQSHIIDALLKSSDLLKQMIDDVHNSDSFDIQEMHTRLLHLSSSETDTISDSNTNDNPPDTVIPDETVTLSTEHEDPENRQQEDFPSEIGLKDAKNRFQIHFDLKGMYHNENISPVDLTRDLQSMGDIVEGRLATSANSMDQDFSTADLTLDIVYETPLEKNVVMTMFMLSESAISDHESEFSDHESEFSDLENKDAASQFHQNVSKTIHAIQEKNKQKKSQAITNEPPQNKPYPVQKTKSDLEPIEELPEKPKPQQSEGKEKKARDQQSPQEASSIRIPVDILDKLMSLASELVLVRNRLLMQSSNTDPIVSDIAHDLDVVTSDMQETVMLTRMQPLGNVLNKMPRIVRDLARRFHKNIDIQISGNDVELDKNILEMLSSPLMHIIRNACDHGIEMPDTRYAVGKSEIGLIEVNAYHQAGLIHIDISDDGKGLDPSMIRTKALEKGIIAKNDLDQLNDKDVLSLIMMPGFSTAAEMSDISGRGVGMDVVKTAISQIGGVIEIDSEPGKGIHLHMSLPLTLAIIPCLIIISKNERFAIPQVNMDEMVRLYHGTDYSIERSGDQEVYRLRTHLLPIVRLNELLKRPHRFTSEDRSAITDDYSSVRKSSKTVLFAVVKTGSRRFGLIIDHMTGTEEIVVNPLPNTIKNLQIYQGTTIMGDGEVAMVLDVDGIARHVGVEFNRSIEEENALVSRKIVSSNIERILTFQYGPKEQFAIPLILVRRLTQIYDNKIEKVGANDDREFVVIDGEPVFIVRLDRMMTVSPCSAQKQYYICLFKKSGTPIGMLFTKLIGVAEMPDNIQEENYNLNCVFGCAIVNDRLTLLLDINELLGKGENVLAASQNIGQEISTKERILLVEDTVFFSQLVRNLLEGNGYQVYTAENGLDGLSVLETNTVDLIISDIEMPVMDGWRFIQAVRNQKKYQHIPAMALTSLNSEESIEKSKEMGFDMHEIKIDKDRMLTGVKNLLHNKRQYL